MLIDLTYNALCHTLAECVCIAYTWYFMSKLEILKIFLVNLSAGVANLL